MSTFGDNTDGMAFRVRHHQRANTVVGQRFRCVSERIRGFYGEDGRALADEDAVYGQARLLKVPGQFGRASASTIPHRRECFDADFSPLLGLSTGP